MKYIKLELRKNNINIYFLGFVVVLFFGIIFSEFLMLVANFDASAATKLRTYQFIYFISDLIITVGVIVVGTTMMGKFILEEYKEPRVFLTLSYPVKRTTILGAKLILCVSTIAIFSFILQLLIYVLEKIFHILPDDNSFILVLEYIPKELVNMVFAICICILGLNIGWIKKSIPLSLVASVLIYSCISNALLADQVGYILIFVVIIFAVITLMILKYLIVKIRKMEV